MTRYLVGACVALALFAASSPADGGELGLLGPEWNSYSLDIDTSASAPATDGESVFLATHSSDPDYPDSILEVDWRSGEIIDSIALGEWFTALTTTPDGSNLYAARAGGPFARLSTSPLALEWSIDDVTSGGTYLDKIRVSPTNPELVAIAFAGGLVRLLNNGVPLPDELAMSSTGIEFSQDGSTLYVVGAVGNVRGWWNAEVGDSGLTAGLVAEVESWGDLYLSESDGFAMLGTQVFSFPAIELLGTLPTSERVAVIPGTRRAVAYDQAIFIEFDLDSFTEVGRTRINPMGGGLRFFDSVQTVGTEAIVLSDYTGVQIVGELHWGSLSGAATTERGLWIPGASTIEIYDDDLNLVAEPYIHKPGIYGPVDLPPGDYYVYGEGHASGQTLSEWYSHAAEYRLDLATPVTIGADESVTGIDITVPDWLDDISRLSDEFQSSIQWLRKAGITSGCDLDSFCPEEPVTRGQMASFLVRARRLPPTGVDYFTDDAGDIHEAAINALRESGITLGCTATGEQFCPNDEVTRAQMASFLVRALDLPNTSVDYFGDDEASTHESAINALRESEITLGCTTESYCPEAPVIRVHMAAFLHRSLADEFGPAIRD